MIRELAQAGNRAGKTGRYLQWWDSVAEQTAAAPVTQKLYNHHLPILSFSSLPFFFFRSKKELTGNVSEPSGTELSS